MINLKKTRNLEAVQIMDIPIGYGSWTNTVNATTKSNHEK
jgi:hypothetical protein